jgi:hypothetical protein
MTDVVTLSSKNQFTLPVAMVRQLGLVKGSKLWTKMDNKSILITRLDDSWDSLQGTIKDTPLTKGKSTMQIIKLAGKLEGKRLVKKYEL